LLFVIDRLHIHLEMRTRLHQPPHVALNKFKFVIFYR